MGPLEEPESDSGIGGEGVRGRKSKEAGTETESLRGDYRSGVEQPSALGEVVLQ